MPDFDTSVPHIARVYDYWLGGRTATWQRAARRCSGAVSPGKTRKTRKTG